MKRAKDDKRRGGGIMPAGPCGDKAGPTPAPMAQGQRKEGRTLGSAPPGFDLDRRSDQKLTVVPTMPKVAWFSLAARFESLW